MKTVFPITDEAIRVTLREAHRHAPYSYVRERAHAVLLSSRGFSMSEIAKIYEVEYQVISRWLDSWEDYGIQGLYKGHNGGRKPIYNSSEEDRVKALVAEEPRRLSYVQSKIEKETGKTASKSTVGRIVKKLGLVYKRLRKSCKHKRDEEQFQCSKKALESAQQAEDKGSINLFYFDESGFCQEPCVPYGWQEKGSQLRIPSVKSKRVNVLGFINRANDLFYYPVIGSVDSMMVIDIFDYFTYQMTAPEYGGGDRFTVIIIDNASIHTSKAFRAKIDDWLLEKKVLVCFLPTYSPELNLIEMLWKKAKYEWMNILSIMNFKFFEEEVNRVFDAVGQEYIISFAGLLMRREKN